jgi:anaerobic magnesium-protoporphyrin IX monomethyl ester cyclase
MFSQLCRSFFVRYAKSLDSAMKVLLTHAYFLNEDRVGQRDMTPYPPLGILYISTYLKKNNIEHSVFDTTFSSKIDLLHYISEEKPDLIGFHSGLASKLNVLEIVNEIKNNIFLKNTRIIIGGPDVSFNIENYLQYGADFLVIGEGEITLFELIKTLEEKKDPAMIKGIAFKNEMGEIIRTQTRERIKNLDILGCPNREAIDIQKYFNSWNEKHGYMSANISTQRGCPFSCNWCCSGVFGHTFVQRSVDNVIDEITYLVQTYGIQSVRFVEDLFTINRSWTMDFCEKLTHLKLPLTFECTTRAETLTDETIQLLKMAGCSQLWIGAESGSQQVLNAMNTQTEIGKLIIAFKLLKKYSIEAGVFIMLGYPGESRKDIIRTMQLIKQARPDYFAISLSYPIKGTDFYNVTETQFTHIDPWSTSTDIDIEFKRTYSKRFYRFAMSWMVNEMNYYKIRRISYKAIRSKFKSIIAFNLMNLEVLYSGLSIS